MKVNDDKSSKLINELILRDKYKYTPKAPIFNPIHLQFSRCVFMNDHTELLGNLFKPSSSLSLLIQKTKLGLLLFYLWFLMIKSD